MTLKVVFRRAARAELVRAIADASPMAIGSASAVLAVVLGIAWTSDVFALDRVGAIDAAKRQVRNKCTDETPCTFTAKLESNKWYVRVEFTKRAAPQAKPLPYRGGHAIFVFDQSGKVVGRIEGQ